MLTAYVSGHGFGHATRLCEVLRSVRARAPGLPITVVGAVPTWLLRAGVEGPLTHRSTACDVGLAQRDALTIDEAATAARCRALEAQWESRVGEEVAFLGACRTRLVVGDIPPLAFAAAARAGVPSIALGNFSWDWIHAHLARREPTLAAAARQAAAAYAESGLLLELPFAGDLSAFPRRERVGLVARRPRVDWPDARRRLGLDSRPAVLLSFGGVGLPGTAGSLDRPMGSFRLLTPADIPTERLDALGLGYPDVVGAVDVVVTKPGYGIVSDAIGAGTRLVYTERGDFPEYPIMVAEMPRYLACVHLSNDRFHAGELADAVDRVLRLPMPAPPDLGGADRAATRILEALG